MSGGRAAHVRSGEAALREGFDLVIVGGGAAGCVVAAERLAEQLDALL